MPSMLRWDDCDTYEPGFKLGSSGPMGEHQRDTDGWPYSIYRRAIEPGFDDVVICHGIQDLDDAKQILGQLQCLA